jgi:hypothetical protein
VGVDAYLVYGDVDAFFSEYNLNVSHRVMFNEVLKHHPIGVSAFIEMNDT